MSTRPGCTTRRRPRHGSLNSPPSISGPRPPKPGCEPPSSSDSGELSSHVPILRHLRAGEGRSRRDLAPRAPCALPSRLTPHRAGNGARFSNGDPDPRRRAHGVRDFPAHQPSSFRPRPNFEVRGRRHTPMEILTGHAAPRSRLHMRRGRYRPPGAVGDCRISAALLTRAHPAAKSIDPAPGAAQPWARFRREARAARPVRKQRGRRPLGQPCGLAARCGTAHSWPPRRGGASPAARAERQAPGRVAGRLPLRLQPHQPLRPKISPRKAERSSGVIGRGWDQSSKNAVRSSVLIQRPS